MEGKVRLCDTFITSVQNNLTLFGGFVYVRLVGKLSPFPGMKHLDVAGGTG